MNIKKQYFTLALAFTLIIGGSVAVLAQNKKNQDRLEINNTLDDLS